MKYRINKEYSELGGLEILKSRLNSLEGALAGRGEVINIVDAAFAHKETRKILTPCLKDSSELDNKYQDFINKFARLC